MRLFFTIIYWGILARLYILAGNFRKWHEANSPYTILGGGREWRCNDTFHSYDPDVPPVYEDDLPHICAVCHRQMQHVRPGKWQCDCQDCKSTQADPKPWRVKSGWTTSAVYPKSYSDVPPVDITVFPPPVDISNLKEEDRTL